jgi:hypothetical protein
MDEKDEIDEKVKCEKTGQKMTMEDIVRKLLIVVTLFMLLVSLWGLYTSLNSMIQIWVGYKYAPVYRVLLNLSVLVIAIYVLNVFLGKK